CDNNCIVQSKSIDEAIDSTKPCFKCVKINLKKFKPIDEQICLSTLDNDFGRCICGKRPLDIVMAHVLKLMVEEKMDVKSLKLKDGPAPLPNPLSSNLDIFLKENSLVLIHPNFDDEIANRLINEVSEIKAILKGNSSDLIGLTDINDSLKSHKLLKGCDYRCEIVETPLDKIVLNKQQSKVHIERSPVVENKILKLNNYFKSKHLSEEEISQMSVLDGTSGIGSLGIFSLLYGFNKVVFNDLNLEALKMACLNLEANGFKTTLVDDEDKNLSNPGLIAYGDKFQIYNLPFEKWDKHFSVLFDFCIVDTFPQTDNKIFHKIADKIAKNTIFI
ncbi:MAG: hypothetical protein LBU40_02815, partial [Methanobrevibacter sp.]|nr:hypothetical protein [Methanobrevibacter sp.]